MQKLSFTWLGHATFLLTSPGGKRILFDPWVTGNPSSSGVGEEDRRARPDADHARARRSHRRRGGDRRASSGAQVVAPFELSVWLQQKGLKHVTGMNPGGTLHALGLSITMVPALHSSSVEEDGQIVYLGRGDRLRRLRSRTR